MLYFFIIFPIQDADSTAMSDLAIRDKDGKCDEEEAFEESDLVVFRRDSNSALSILIFPENKI